MQAEAQISVNPNTNLQPENAVSIQNGDPGVSSSLSNAATTQQPGQFLTFILIFYYVWRWVLIIDACDGWEVKDFIIFPVVCSSEETDQAVGCLDSSRGGKLLHRITTSWEGMFIFIDIAFHVVVSVVNNC